MLAMRAAPGERPSACVGYSTPVAGGRRGEGEGVGGVGGVDDETLCGADFVGR